MNWRSFVPGVAWLWLAVPVALLIATQVRNPTTPIEVRESIASSLPQNEFALLGLVDALHEEGRDEEALAAARAAAELRPESVPALEKLLAVQAVLGLEHAANATYERLVALGVENGDSLTQLAVSMHRSNPEAAERLYRRAIEIDPTSRTARMNLASLLADRGDLATALEHYAEVVRSAPRDPTALYNLGVLELRAERFYEAARRFEAALQLRPDHPEAARMLRIARQRADRSRSQERFPRRHDPALR